MDGVPLLVQQLGCPQVNTEYNSLLAVGGEEDGRLETDAAV